MPVQTPSTIVNMTLWLLAAFSIATWTLIISKGIGQWRRARWNRHFHRAFWNATSLTEAERMTHDAQGPLARLCQAGFIALQDMRSGQHNLQRSGERRDILERYLRQQVQKEQHQMENGLMILASIGSTAPFVGLFGTVWGIMHALQEIGSAGSATLDVVAGPIGEALVATAIGIATAVPAVLAYNFYLRQLRSGVAELENFATDFMHLIARSDHASQQEEGA